MNVGRIGHMLAVVAVGFVGVAGLAAAGTVVLEGIPHVRQKPDFCGEACVAAWLRKVGLDVDQDVVFDHSGLDPHLGRGCFTKELATAMRNLGLEPGPVWYSVRVDQADEQIGALWKQVRAELAAGRPSIVCTRFDTQPDTTEHFRLVVGYDVGTDEVVYHDPAIDRGGYLRMKRADFLGLWPLKYRQDAWTVIWLRMKQVKDAKAKRAEGLTAADFAQHVMQLKKRLPDGGFSFVIQPPFVVIGDEDPRRVRNRSEQTVRWAVDNLKTSFFKKEPTEILDIWLFKDKASYEKHATELFGSRPTTPYGYYSSRHRALVMNISTGGGTLVHEIVHPFVAADFPKCPSWLNEGLGSLFEQCGTRDGRIEGFTNWRLAGLQETIRNDRLPSFHRLCSTTTIEFYNDPSGTNYAQARYLCYYLQERDLLRTFYRRFREGHAKDPTGYKTLQAVLGTTDMAVFQEKWEAYVLGLRFP